MNSIFAVITGKFVTSRTHFYPNGVFNSQTCSILGLNWIHTSTPVEKNNLSSFYIFQLYKTNLFVCFFFNFEINKRSKYFKSNGIGRLYYFKLWWIICKNKQLWKQNTISCYVVTHQHRMKLHRCHVCICNMLIKIYNC